MRNVLLLMLPVLGWAGAARAQNAWINELHYDDVGSDLDEAVEVVIEGASMSVDPADFTVTLYNGNDGASYATHGVGTFEAGAMEGAFTVFYKLISGIQNGGPDGLALDYQGTVLEFICYEGTFTAAGGPADGLTCTDMGVAEEPAVAEGISLQRVGTAAVGSGFTWSEGAASPGAVNTGQVLDGGTDPCADFGTVPFWDGVVGVLPGGLGELQLSAPVGLASVAVDLTSSVNIAVVAVTDAAGTPLPDYVGMEPLAGTENGGFAEFAYTGSPGGEAPEARVVVGALEEGPSSFFIDVTDTCQRTLYVDPYLELLAPGQGGGGRGERPVAAALEQNYPNPFNPTTTIRFELKEAVPVRLVVYDVRGRVVRTLVEGVLEGGMHEVAWDGRATGGRRLPSGVYNYRLEAGGEARTRQMILVQ